MNPYDPSSPETPRTPPELRRTPSGSDANWQNASTQYISQPNTQPSWPPYQSQPPKPRQSPLLWAVITLGVLVLLLAGALTYLGMSRTSKNGQSGSGSATATSTPGNAQPTPTVTVSVAGQTFQTGQTYTYNDIIGHSKQTALTNSDINVSVVSLALDGSANQTTVTVSFQNLDTTLSGDFLFEQANNVYLIDQHGARYQTLQASPPEVIVEPGQTVTMTVTFSLLSASATQVQFYFNTDHDALDTTCALLFPSQLAQTC